VPGPPIPGSADDRLARLRALPVAAPVLDGLAGEEGVHVVGGAVRDLLLDRTPAELDLVVEGDALPVARRAAERLGGTVVEHPRFGTATVRVGDVVFDLAGAREERYERPGALPEVTVGATLADDLARRDFTVNAFALDLRSGELIDPFGGVADLERRLLRATTPESFTGDPLRVLRLPRLLLRLPGFAADPQTLTLARASTPGLDRIAAERVRDELAMLFAHPEAHRGLAMLVALDVYPGLWLGRPGEPGRPGGAIAELEALPERVREMREIDTAAADAVNGPAARLAASFAHLPALGGRGPLQHLEMFRDVGYLTRQEAAKVALLLGWEELPASDLGQRRFLHRAGPLWATAAASLGARSPGRAALERWRSLLHPLLDLARSEGEALFDPPRLLSGGEVQELLGVPPGPEVGKALAAVRQAQVDGKVRTRAEAVGLLRGQTRTSTD
jgi:tRNA nucleotidyltransferase (CCA-adding enzyme)